uniref:Uncharacterized protein n=1 Tax=Rhizophora mucronata TaxID=61149 RepID=A0A2P2R492_RHIMU
MEENNKINQTKKHGSVSVTFTYY